MTDWYELANTYRPDVGNYLGPSYGNYHGFIIDVAVPGGSDGYGEYGYVCVEGQNNGVYNDLNQCLTYYVDGAFFGGRFSQTPGSIVQVGYHIESSNYPGQVASAANNYNTTYSAVYMPVVPMANSKIDIYNEYQYQDKPGVVGRTYFEGSCIPPGSGGPPYVGCHQYWAKITLYDVAMSTLSYAWQTHVMIHETGHALGLTHTQNSNGSVMRPNVAIASATLTSYDLANISHLYPY